MEYEAHCRDQTSWACSAQNSKLLPKRPVRNNKVEAGLKIKSMVGPLFEEARKQNDKTKNHSR